MIRIVHQPIYMCIIVRARKPCRFGLSSRLSAHQTENVLALRGILPRQSFLPPPMPLQRKFRVSFGENYVCVARVIRKLAKSVLVYSCRHRRFLYPKGSWRVILIATPNHCSFENRHPNMGMLKFHKRHFQGVHFQCWRDVTLELP